MTATTFTVSASRAGLRSVIVTETKSTPSTYVVSDVGVVSETQPAATTNDSKFFFGT